MATEPHAGVTTGRPFSQGACLTTIPWLSANVEISDTGVAVIRESRTSRCSVNAVPRGYCANFSSSGEIDWS